MTSTSIQPTVASSPCHDTPCAQTGPFPSLIVRPATATPPTYLRRHVRRQGNANRLAAALTERCRAGLGPGSLLEGDIWVDIDDPRDDWWYLPSRQVVDDIIAQAPVLAADAPPGAVRVGRDGRGRPVVAVLHAPRWSLVLRRVHPDPAGWVFIGATGKRGFRFCGSRARSVAWQDMTRAVYTTLTGDTG